MIGNERDRKNRQRHGIGFRGKRKFADKSCRKECVDFDAAGADSGAARGRQASAIATQHEQPQLQQATFKRWLEQTCAEVFAYVGETCQVLDLPSLQFEVAEHHATQSICSSGRVHTGKFPVGVNATVHYGPRAQAAMVHLNQNHAVRFRRYPQQNTDSQKFISRQGYRSKLIKSALP